MSLPFPTFTPDHLHPILVNFTSALMPASIASDAAGRIFRKASLHSAAWWMLIYATAPPDEVKAVQRELGVRRARTKACTAPFPTARRTPQVRDASRRGGRPERHGAAPPGALAERRSRPARRRR